MNDKYVLFLIDSLNVGGAEKSILDIASRFNHYTPIVCHIYTGSSLKTEFEKRGIQVISLDVPPPYNWFRAARAVAKVISRIRPVIVHASLFKSDVVSRLVVPRFHIPLINSFVNNSYHPSRFEGARLTTKLKLMTIQFVDAVTARRVNMFVSNSSAVMYSNSRALHVPVSKIKVIYRGRDVTDFQQQENHDELRQQLDLESGYNVLLNVSRLIPRKGQLELLSAFKMVLSDFPKSYLLIAGDGHYRQVLENEINILGLETRVRLLGSCGYVARLMQMADCFVFPSHYEGLPGVLIEAMMSRLPIVASDIPENRECVSREMATFFTPGDVSGMAEAIKRTLANKTAGMQRAEFAYREALDKFDILKVAQQYEHCYDELRTNYT